jgi:hypothetical protein
MQSNKRLSSRNILGIFTGEQKMKRTEKEKREEKREDDDYRTNFSGMFALGSMVKEDYEILKREGNTKPYKPAKKKASGKKKK